MKIIKTTFAILIITFSACINEPTENSMVIKTGTSFGFCVGYCSLEATIKNGDVEYVSSSWDKTKYPTKVINLGLSNFEWAEIVANIDMDKFEELDEVIGCPDCADGGSEWIEIIFPGRRKKVTFEYGDSLKGINDLLEQLRLIRNSYNVK